MLVGKEFAAWFAKTVCAEHSKADSVVDEHCFGHPFGVWAA